MSSSFLTYGFLPPRLDSGGKLGANSMPTNAIRAPTVPRYNFSSNVELQIRSADPANALAKVQISLSQQSMQQISDIDFGLCDALSLVLLPSHTISDVRQVRSHSSLVIVRKGILCTYCSCDSHAGSTFHSIRPSLAAELLLPFPPSLRAASSKFHHRSFAWARPNC
jgi:hypothetical protein